MALRNKKALIVDDDPFVSELLAEILASEGCAVDTAGDGNEAYNKFHADPDISVVISDLNMPGMDGLQLLRKLRDENVGVPFVMLTGNNEISSAKEAIKKGADDYILKDENIQDAVVPSVKKVLEEYKLKTAGYQDIQRLRMRKRLEALHARFAGTLPERILQLEECCAAYLKNRPDPEVLETAVRAAHTLAGSAASFGFKDVSSAAKNLEAALKTGAETEGRPDEELEPKVSACVESLKAALLERDSSFDAKVGFGPPEISSSPPHGKIVFILEDDPRLLHTLSLQMLYFGYQVRPFTSFADLRDGATHTVPSVIIIDITISEGDSSEALALREIRNEIKGIVPIIFISGSADFDVRLKAVRAGAEAYFVKPLNIASLIDKLDALTSGQTIEPYRILIVDDDAELSAYYSLILTQAGMITEIANDPVKVVSHISEFSPDLILMDMYMPVCNGRELSKVIRQMDSFVSIPIVFLSSEMNLEKQLTAMGTGGDDFLTKPIQPDHLISSISLRAERMRTIRSFMHCDSLTGLLNHTKIKEQMDFAVERARRRDGKLSFAMIDIDRFKTVNDTYGHPAGDRVIKSLSTLLRQRLRRTDIIGRYGGEEFAVILDDTEAEKALIILDEIRVNFSGIKHQAEGKEFYSTFSCGIAAFPQCPDENCLANTADKALYEAKNSGRNRVILKKE